MSILPQFFKMASDDGFSSNYEKKKKDFQAYNHPTQAHLKHTHA